MRVPWTRAAPPVPRRAVRVPWTRAAPIALLLALYAFILLPTVARAADSHATAVSEQTALLRRQLQQMAAGGAEQLSLPFPDLEQVHGARPGSRAAAILKYHSYGYLQFTAVLSMYLTLQMAARVEAGEMTAAQALQEIQRAAASQEAFVAYAKFVGIYAALEKAGGLAFRRRAPPRNLSRVRKLGRTFVHHHALLVAVVSLIDVGDAFQDELRHPPAPPGPPPSDVARHVSQELLSSLEKAPDSTMDRVMSAFGRAMGRVDFLEIVVSQAAFVAGMLAASMVPGLGQSGIFNLAVGFAAADLAQSYLLEPTRETIVHPLQVGSAVSRLARVSRLSGLAPRRRWRNRSPVKGDLARESKEARKGLADAFEEQSRAEREHFEERYRELALLGTRKLSDRVSKLVRSRWIDGHALPFTSFTVSRNEELARVPLVMEQLVEEIQEAEEDYREVLQDQREDLHRAIPLPEETLSRLEEVDATDPSAMILHVLEIASGVAGEVVGPRRGAEGPAPYGTTGAGEAPDPRARVARELVEFALLEEALLRSELAMLEQQQSRLPELLSLARRSVRDAMRKRRAEIAVRGASLAARVLDPAAPLRAALSQPVRRALVGLSAEMPWASPGKSPIRMGVRRDASRAEMRELLDLMLEDRSLRDAQEDLRSTPVVPPGPSGELLDLDGTTGARNLSSGPSGATVQTLVHDFDSKDRAYREAEQRWQKALRKVRQAEEASPRDAEIVKQWLQEHFEEGKTPMGLYLGLLLELEATEGASVPAGLEQAIREDRRPLPPKPPGLAPPITWRMSSPSWALLPAEVKDSPWVQAWFFEEYLHSSRLSLRRARAELRSARQALDQAREAAYPERGAEDPMEERADAPPGFNDLVR